MEERERPGQAGLSTGSLCHPLRVKNQRALAVGEDRELCDLKLARKSLCVYTWAFKLMLVCKYG